MPLPAPGSALALRLAEAGFVFGEPIAPLAMNAVIKAPLGEGAWLVYQDPSMGGGGGSTTHVSFLVAPNGEKVARMQVWIDKESAKRCSSMTACDPDEPPLKLSDGHVEDGYHWICLRLAWKAALKAYQECIDRDQQQLDVMYAQLREDMEMVQELGAKLEFSLERRVLNTSSQ